MSTLDFVRALVGRPDLPGNWLAAFNLLPEQLYAFCSPWFIRVFSHDFGCVPTMLGVKVLDQFNVGLRQSFPPTLLACTMRGAWSSKGDAGAVAQSPRFSAPYFSVAFPSQLTRSPIFALWAISSCRFMAARIASSFRPAGFPTFRSIWFLYSVGPYVQFTPYTR